MSERMPSGELSGLSDSALTSLVRQGPRRNSLLAVAELFSRHWTGVYRYAGLCTLRPAAAIELAKEAFLLVQREARDSEAQSFAWRPRLLATVLACARTWSTSERRADLNTELLAWLGDPDNDGEAEQGGPPTLARRAFAQLPEQSQCLLWHSVVEGDPPTVISRLTGQGGQAAARQLERARRLFREECVQAHLTRTIDRECLAYGSLIDAATRTETAGSGPKDLEGHLAGCIHCRAAAEELDQHGDRLALLLADGLLAWGAKPYLDTRKTDHVHDAGPPRAVPRPQIRPAALAAAAGLAAIALVAIAAAMSNLVAAPADGDAAAPKAGPSTASPRPGTQVIRIQLRNAKTGKCLDIDGGTPAAEADVVSARCTSAKSQQWVFGNDSLLHTSADPDLCLDTTGDGNVILRSCGHGLRLVWNDKGEIATSTSPDLALTPVPTDDPDDVVLKIRDGSRAQIWLGGRSASGTPLTKRAAPSPSDKHARHTSSPRPVPKTSPSRSPQPPAPSPTPSPLLKVTFGQKGEDEMLGTGHPYVATLTGFVPDHDVRLSWSSGTEACRTDRLTSLKRTDSTGRAVDSGTMYMAPGTTVTFCADEPDGSRRVQATYVLG